MSGGWANIIWSAFSNQDTIPLALVWEACKHVFVLVQPCIMQTHKMLFDKYTCVVEKNVIWDGCSTIVLKVGGWNCMDNSRWGEVIADFHALFFIFHICNFDICHETQTDMTKLTNTNAKS